MAVVLSFALAALAGATPGSAQALTRSIGSLPPKVKASSAHAHPAAPSNAGIVTKAGGAEAMGFCGGDDWEPEIATAPDGLHVYLVWAHFPGDPTCDPASGNPNRIYIRTSNDGGKTFGPSHVVAELISGVSYPRQVDCVVTVDPKTGAVYVSFLAYGRPHHYAGVVAVAKSVDFGATFDAVAVNGPLCGGCDHPWTVAYGKNVYTAYAHADRHFLSHSSDGGTSWTETDVLDADAVAFPEGAVMDADHNVYMAWGDCTTPNCKGDTAGDYRVSRTTAGTSKTVFYDVATAPAGPTCPYVPDCGFAFFGIQNDIAIDAAGTLYMVWQDGQDHSTTGSPPIVQLSASVDQGQTWSYVGRVDDKTAMGCPNSACYALFPRIEGGAPGQIATMWMDDRLGLPINHTNGWNVWLRTSITGGNSWTGPSRRVSTFDRHRPQSEQNGFRFPYGDYEGIDLRTSGDATRAVMIWGEGINYAGGPANPGGVVYRSMSL
jgi:hypothetical protein